VDNDKGSFITAYGSGLSQGNSGKESEFFIAGNSSELSLLHTTSAMTQ